MITIHHNFDESQFKWLWAKYVKAGNIEKHCTASLIGSYSKKFSGSTNQNLLSQPTLVMDEIPEGGYEAIYFCGVLKKGYLNKNPDKNNYRHNVHFAVRPVANGHDVWNFENWHVEIDGGVLERIPDSYELKDRFFHTPYTSHYYTCRIFRWMVGHFYPQELIDVVRDYPEKMLDASGTEVNMRQTIMKFIQLGKDFVHDFMMEESRRLPVVLDEQFDECWRNIKNLVENGYKIKLLRCETPKKIKDKVMSDNLITRRELTIEINKMLEGISGAHYICPSGYESAHLLGNNMENYFALGIEEGLDMYFPYQERNTVLFNKVV